MKILLGTTNPSKINRFKKLLSGCDVEFCTPEDLNIVDKPSTKRHIGWPLDSISINKNTLTYFVDKDSNKHDTTKENIMIGKYKKRLTSFLKEALEIN